MKDQEKRKIYSQRYYQKNKERIKEYRKKYRKKPEVIKKRKAYQQKYRRKNKERIKNYNQTNKEHIKKKKKVYYQNNKCEIKKKIKKYYQSHKKQIKEYQKNNRKKINERRNQNRKKRYNKDPLFNLKYKLSNILRKTLKNYSKTGKIQSSKKHGINYKKIIEYLKPFPKDIENYHVDHVIPLSYFNFNNKEEIKWAFSPENHQWLTKEENIAKGNKFIGKSTSQ